MSGATAQVVDRGVSRALSALAGRLDNLEAAWEQVGARAVAAVSPFVPVESGALVDDLQAEASPTGVEVSIGSGVEYAGVINFGSEARNITAVRFMDKAEPVIEQEAPDQLAQEIQHAIDVLGLH